MKNINIRYVRVCNYSVNIIFHYYISGTETKLDTYFKSKNKLLDVYIYYYFYLNISEKCFLR